MKIIIFKEPAFTAMNEYNANDLEKLFQSKKMDYCLINHHEVEKLKRTDCDLLVIPYIDGDFSRKALQALLDFHGDGGSLFFLGDLPHRERWYPIRNMHAFPFHLTRCYDDISISADKPKIHGLTEKGQEILGKFEDLDFVKGRQIPALRITAFPPDEAYPLLAISSDSHANTSSAVMVAERKCSKFLGAKFAMIGFNGGEPRENVAGVYEKKWTYDPGLLTREWKGLNPMILKLLDWLKPEGIAGAIDADSVAGAGKINEMTVQLRNLTNDAQKMDSVNLIKNNQVVWEQTVSLEPGKKLSINIPQEQAVFGIHNYQLIANFANQQKRLASFTERVLPEYPDIYNVSKGYGFSTYWSFQSPQITDEFKFFCHEMKRRGCTYLRANIPWEDVEPEPGIYDWSIPDQMLEFAESENITLQFWMFPTTRASGLGDLGVPEWTLKEAAIDRYGNKGLFPSIWSPFYRKHYFGMLTEFTKRYANNPNLSRFILDFGNSDFPYGYYYYVNDTTLFDYSEHERKAFAAYLKNELEWNLEKVNQLFSAKFADFTKVPVPYAEQKEPYRVYLDFRTWSLREGINTVHEIISTNAPEKLPPDLPGHGLGSIADISTAFYEAKKRHWLEECKFDKKYVEQHNAGLEWGGEAWQVGGTYSQYDDALFGSLRYNASYNSIPGADLGLYGDDIAKIGFIRKSIMGASRNHPELAVFDRTTWHDHNSLTHVATRLDFPVDLICAKHRYDFSCYKLMTMPDCDTNDRTSTGGGGGMLVPSDEYWYYLIRESVEKGLNLVIYPKTCEIRKNTIQRTFLRQILNLEDVEYSEFSERTVEFPDSFGEGSLTGKASEVISDGEVLLRDTNGKAVLIKKQYGKGSRLLAGWDSSKGSLDHDLHDEQTQYLENHTLLKLCNYFNIKSAEIDTGNLYVFKEILHKENDDYLLLFSHNQQTITGKIKVKLTKQSNTAMDLATGEQFKLKKLDSGWYQFPIELKTRQGRYLAFQD
jgi:glycosyl hydrolase family 42 (putative beta-galactosidase)